MNYSVFGKAMENVRKIQGFKLVTTDKRKKCLLSQPNFHTTKWIQHSCNRKFFSNRNKKTSKLNKPV